MFKFQFETVDRRNGWTDDEKALELILALKSAAAGILESISTSRRNNYNELKVELQRKFDDKTNGSCTAWNQGVGRKKVNEPLRWMLVQLTYPIENYPLIDNIKTEAFVKGIRDPGIKLTV